MIIIAFFYLLRPGEYTDSASDTTPFTLADVQLFVGHRRLNLQTATDEELFGATAASLTFTLQKNGIPGEVIRLGRSGDAFCCPTLAIVRRVVHLRAHGAPPNTPLARTFTPSGTRSVTPKDITFHLRAAVQFLGTDLGFLPDEISARSLRAGGAMALLVSDIDTDMIRLMGRGAQMKCSDTSTSPQIPSLRALLAACSLRTTPSPQGSSCPVINPPTSFPALFFSGWRMAANGWISQWQTTTNR